MRRGGVLLLVLLAGCGGQPQRQAVLPADFRLVSKSIDLPDDGAPLPEAAAIVTQNCTGCHSSEMLTTQPVLDAKTWAAEIDKMRKVYHAPVDASDDARLIAALTALPTQRGGAADAPRVH